MKFLLSVLFMFSSFSIVMGDDPNNTQMNLHIKQYVLKNYCIEKPPKKFLMNSVSTNTAGQFMVLETVAVYENGLNVETKYIEDIFFVFCLEKRASGWEVVYDLSRNDVPSKEEMEYIKKSFPSTFPKKLLPKFWQKKFNP